MGFETIIYRVQRLLGLVEVKEEPSTGQIAPYWCVAANVVTERPYGQDGEERRPGTKHFKPGAKVYVIDAYWGMGGERVVAVGHHRGSKRYVTITMAAKHLTNWRVELTYSPHIIDEMKKRGDLGKFEPNSVDGKNKAEAIAAALRNYGPSSQPFTSHGKAPDRETPPKQ
jgi:hypothetical protein